MKTLYIMTHPKKDEKSSQDDFLIPLSQEGINDAHQLSKHLIEKNINPDIIVSSPALRAETTSMILSEALDIKKKTLFNEVLYQGFLDELIEAINFTFYSVEKLMIVGHSPLLSSLANHFVGYKEKLKSGVVMHIDFDTSSWVDISPQNAKLIEIIEP